ncbi:unnamed protein product [Euphydryas editha]|uniref:Uncharacterized protein n=1 Tax=Euphydryas editha TaxID=104508 RepID=A0AAU9TAF6_EUPED|nr:unnamed protein product [Euphydryas editha]
MIWLTISTIIDEKWCYYTFLLEVKIMKFLLKINSFKFMNKNLILERRKEFECNLDLEKTLEICRQLGRDDDNEDEQLRNEANVIFEEDPYARLLQDVNSVVNADI